MRIRRIFISYRRDDSEDDAVRLKKRLEQEFGADCAFIDVDHIGPGTNFEVQITKEISNCDILLAVIGPKWLDLLKRRIDDPHDHVRVEVRTAIERPIFVIPILLEGTKIPRKADLPQDLQELPARNGVNLRSASFDDDMDQLARAIRFRFDNPLLARFEGWRLEKAFANQELASGDKMIAKELAERSNVEELKKGKNLYFEKEPGMNSLFFALSGSIRLSARRKHIYDVKPNEVLGEFPILVTEQDYTVSPRALDTSVVARVSEDQFRSIAKAHPELWENMARMLAKRLRDRTASSRRKS
jgi:CRP-like cAMP-binding protein